MTTRNDDSSDGSGISDPIRQTDGSIAPITPPTPIPGGPSVAAPSELRATAFEDRVELSWKDNSNNEDGFKIKRKKPNDAEFEDAGSVAPNVTTFMDATVKPNKTYIYRVRAVRNDGTGAASEDVTVTVPPVNAPSNLTAVAVDGRVELDWLDNSNIEDGYIVKRKRPNDVDFTDIKTLPANTSSYVDQDDIKPGKTYLYRVRAIRNDGTGAGSPDASVTIPLPAPVAAPSGLTATATQDSVELNWIDNSNNEDGFKILRKRPNDSDFAELGVPLAPNTTRYVDTQVQPDTTYRYRVRAFSNNGVEADSNTVMVTTPRPLDTARPSVSAVALSPTKASYQPNDIVTIAWQSSDNVGVVAHEVRFSATGAAPFETLAADLGANKKSYTWTVPNRPTMQGVIQIAARDAAGNEGRANSGSFAIAVVEIAPTSGPAGSDVEISGINLAAATQVRFGNVAAEFVYSAPKLIAEVPDGAPLSAPISLTFANGTMLASAINFTLAAAGNKPSVQGFTPASGRAGVTELTVTGVNFVANKTVVLFNARPKPIRAPANVLSPTQCKVLTPSEALTGAIRIKAPNGKSAPSIAEYVIGPPSIAQLSVTRGRVGDTVTINGENFVIGETTVRFNGVIAPNPTVSTRAITCKVPAGAGTGPLTVQTPQGTAASESPFTVDVPVAPNIRSLNPTQVPVGETTIVIVSGSDLPTLAAGYRLLTTTGQTVAGARVLSATLRSDTQVAVELSIDATVALGEYRLEARTEAGADTEPLTLVADQLSNVSGQNPPFRAPPAQNTGQRFVLRYGALKPSIVLVFTNSPSLPIGFSSLEPTNVTVDEINGTFSFNVDSAGPWSILVRYDNTFSEEANAFVATSPVAPGEVNIARSLATHTVAFRPIDFMNREIVPGSFGDSRTQVTYRLVHRQTGVYLGFGVSGFGRARRVFLSDVPPEYTFSAAGAAGRRFGIPLHIYLYMFRRGVRANLTLTNSAAQLVQRDIIGPERDGALFVIPELSFLNYSADELQTNGGFARASGVFEESVSAMLGSDRRAPLYVLFSSDASLDLADPASTRQPDFPVFRLGLFTGDERPLLGLTVSPFYTNTADAADGFFSIRPARAQIDRARLPAAGPLGVGVGPLFDATIWAADPAANQNLRVLQAQHNLVVGRVEGRSHALADNTLDGSLDLALGESNSLQEDVKFKLIRNGKVIRDGLLLPSSFGDDFLTIDAGVYRFLMDHPGLPNVGRILPFQTRSSFTVAAGRNSTPPALRALRLLSGGRLAGAIDAAAGAQNILSLNLSPGTDAGSALQDVGLALSRDGGRFERLTLTSSANGDLQASLPMPGTAARFDFKLAAANNGGNRLVTRFSLPVGANRVSGAAKAPDTAFTVSATALSFSATQNGAPASQTLELGSTEEPIGCNVRADVPWLALELQNDTTPATARVSANVAGLTAGSYQGRLTIDADDPTIAASISIPVTLNVVADSGSLALSTIMPAQGANSGGRRVTVKGAGFKRQSKLFVGGAEAQDVQFVDAQTLTAKTPMVGKVGDVNVRVQNPDGKDAVLEKGFEYTNPPKIDEIAPNAGEIKKDDQVAAVRGQFFQDGAQVYFRDPETKQDIKLTIRESRPGEVVVNIPVFDKPAKLTVKVVNPDEGEARLAEGYIYQTAKQQQRVRIRKISPSVILENERQEIRVYGNNLHDAYRKGTFAPRSSTRIAGAKPADVKLLFDDISNEEIVAFTIQPRLKSGAALGSLQRILIQIIASQRPNATQDGLVETFALLTVVPRALPVPISFTASVTPGKTNALVVAGRNMANTRLRLKPGAARAGVALEHQFSDDKIAFALVSLDETADSVNLQIELVSSNNTAVLPRPLEVKISRAANPSGARANLVAGDDDVPRDVAVSGLERVPNQFVIAPTENDSIAYSLSAAPGAPASEFKAPATFSGVPDNKSKNLIVGVEFDLLDIEFDIPLFAYARVIPIFNRGGDEIVDGALARLGKVTPLRFQALFLVLDVRLRIQIKITVFIGVNPFLDFPSTQPFLGTFPTTSLPDNAFGVVVVSINVRVSVNVAVSLFAGLIAPDPAQGLIIRPLLALLFSVGLSNQGRRLDLDGRFVFSISGAFKPLLPAFDANSLQPISVDFGPDRPQEALGFLAYFFARRKDKICGEFKIAQNDFRVDFASPGGESVEFVPMVEKLTVCLPVLSAKGYRDIRIEPPTIVVTKDAQLIVKARGKPIKENGSVAGPEQDIPTDQVTFRPTAFEEISDTEFVDARGLFKVQKIDSEWRVTGLQEGGPRELRAFVTTRGLGNAVLPDKAIAFFLPSSNAEPRVASMEAIADVMVQRVSQAQVFFIDSQNRRLTKERNALGISNYVTTRGLPAPNDTKFDTTSDDPKNFRLEVQARGIDPANKNPIKVILQVTEPESTIPLGASKEYLLTYRNDDVFRGPFLRLVTDEEDQASYPGQTILVKARSTVTAKYVFGKDRDGKELATTSDIPICRPFFEEVRRGDNGFEIDTDPKLGYTEKPLRVLNLDIRVGFIDRNKNNIRDANETPVIDLGKIEDLIKVANERWAPASIQFRAPARKDYKFFPYPSNALDSNNRFRNEPDTENTLQLSPGAFAVVKSSPPSSRGDTVTVYFVPDFDSNAAGSAVTVTAHTYIPVSLELAAMVQVLFLGMPRGDRQDLKFSNIIFIGQAIPNTLAHELGHILLNTNDPFPDPNKPDKINFRQAPEVLFPQHITRPGLKEQGPKRLPQPAPKSDPAAMSHAHITEFKLEKGKLIPKGTLFPAEVFDVPAFARRRRDSKNPLDLGNILLRGGELGQLSSISQPGMSTSLSAAVEGASVRLSWTDNAKNESGYVLERRVDKSPVGFESRAKLAGDVTTFVDTDVQPGSTYIYRVFAFNDDGQSDYSNEATATVMPGPITPPTLRAPSDLTAAVVGQQVNLRWIDNSTEDGFRVERRAAQGAYEVIATVAREATSFADATVASGAIYFYRVKAFSTARESEPSNEIRVALPQMTARVQLSAVPVTQTTIAGRTISFSIGLLRTNYNGPVDLAISGLPFGASAAFSDDPAMDNSSILVIATEMETQTDTYTLLISANAPGVLVAPVTVFLEIGRSRIPTEPLPRPIIGQDLRPRGIGSIEEPDIDT